MTLLVAIFAACITTAIWYKTAPKKTYLGILALMYWSASIMWAVDAIFEYVEMGADYFRPEPYEMLNDLFLGLSVVAFGLVVWILILLIKDPKGVIRGVLFNRKFR